MDYSVDMLPSAEEELAAIFIRTMLRESVFEAALQLEYDLRTDAESVGESRFGDLRIHIVPPFAATFHVDTAQRHVTVLRIWCFAY